MVPRVCCCSAHIGHCAAYQQGFGVPACALGQQDFKPAGAWERHQVLCDCCLNSLRASRRSELQECEPITTVPPCLILPGELWGQEEMMELQVPAHSRCSINSRRCRPTAWTWPGAEETPEPGLRSAPTWTSQGGGWGQRDLERGVVSLPRRLGPRASGVGLRKEMLRT